MISLIFTLTSMAPSGASDQKSQNHETFPIHLNIESVNYSATVYVPNKTTIKAMLIISPSIDGVTVLEISNANYFSKQGYVVIVPELFKTELVSPTPDAEKLNSDYYKSVFSSIGFINYTDQKLNLSPDLPIFALGSSQGGIFTILLAAYIPRIKAAWFAVAGGNLPYIYAHSEVKQIVKFRNTHMKNLGINNKFEYEDYLRIYLKNDPAISCKDITVPFHQTIALRDDSVPTSTQELLVDECPPHNVSRHNVNHTAGAVTPINDRRKIIDFFNKFI